MEVEDISNKGMKEKSESSSEGLINFKIIHEIMDDTIILTKQFQSKLIRDVILKLHPS